MNRNRKSIIFGSEQNYLSGNYGYSYPTIRYKLMRLVSTLCVELFVHSKFKKQVFNSKTSFPLMEMGVF